MSKVSALRTFFEVLAAGSPDTKAPGPGIKPGVDVEGKGVPKVDASPEQVLYDQERTAVETLRTDLGAHQQATHVSDVTKKADAALKKAGEHAKKKNWSQAMAELASARKHCEQGKDFADKYAAFLVKRAAANVMLTAAQTNGWTGIGGEKAALAAADAKAKAPTRDYAGAETELQKVIDGLEPYFTQFYVDEVRTEVAGLKALPGAKFIDKEIAAIEKMLTEQETYITAKEWRKVRLNAGLIGERILMARKIATRRTGFDGERPTAEAALKALEAHGAAVAAPLAELQKRLKDADALATKEDMQFEDATTQLKAIVKDCEKFEALAKAAAEYTRHRGALAGDVTKLRSHAAAAKIKAELDVVQGLLDEAAKAAGDPGAPGTVLALGTDAAKHDIKTASAKLWQANADLATAKSLAEGLGGVAAAEGALQGGPNLIELSKCAETLTKELEAAQKAKDADLAKADLDAATAALGDAKKQIGAGQADAAKKSLATAGEKLTAARRGQIEHGQFVAQHAALTKKLDEFKADKNAAKIQAKIDALAKALGDADAAEKSKDYAKAIVELNKAETASADALAAQTARAAFDKEADLVEADLKKKIYASVKTVQTEELKKARAMADAFDFAGAEKALKTIRNKMGAAEVEGMAKKSPPDPKLREKAKQLFEAGATQELDDLIKKLPVNSKTQVFVDLAESRFPGVAFEPGAAKHPQKAIKRMCELMKDIPEDVIGNPSLKRIGRQKEGGGFYRPSEDLAVIGARPKKDYDSAFEPGVTNLLPPRDPECEPANDKRVDLFDFTMLHEVAHSIDDAKNYMVQHGNKDDHGGWIEHGGDIEPIVDAVVAETGFGTTPEERKYIKDCILRNPAVAPTTFSGDKDRFEKFVKAALTEGVWSNQAMTNDATLGGRVYQEAYSHTWVSYLADARKKGITGYQFRAPGEFFSELYGAWKLGKLKDSNPAVKWLSTVKI